MNESINLNAIADKVGAWCESMRVPDAPYGTYRFSVDDGPNYYASADIAITRAVIGEDLASLSDEHRDQRASILNARQDPIDGHYSPESC